MLVSFPASALAFAFEAAPGAFFSVMIRESSGNHQSQSEINGCLQSSGLEKEKVQKVLGIEESGVTPPSCSAFRFPAIFGDEISVEILRSFSFQVLQLANTFYNVQTNSN